MLSLPDRALLVKLFYQRDENASAALREYRRLKELRRGPMTITNLRKMIERFETTGTLGVQSGRGRKRIKQEQIKEVATAVVDQATANTQGNSSARSISKQTDIPFSTVQKILRKIIKFYPYKITSNQQLLPGDRNTRLEFALRFLARLEVDDDWPWRILWSDEAHFHLHGDINTHNCRIWADANSHVVHQIPLHSPKVTVWCGFTASFINGPYFYKVGRNGLTTCSVNSDRYANMLENFVIPELQQRNCIYSTHFMQDGAPPHIGRRVKDVLHQHFTDDRVISRAFPMNWPPRSPDLNPCDFWLWGYLKSVVYQGHVPDIPTLKERIMLHVRRINTDMLRATVEHLVYRMQLLEHQAGGHIEPNL